MRYTETREWQEKAEIVSKMDINHYMKLKADADKAEDKIEAALDVLTQRHDVASILFHCLLMQHRTHQQSIIGNLYHALSRYGQSSSDGRNEQAVTWATKATKDEQLFPFI